MAPQTPRFPGYNKMTINQICDMTWEQRIDYLTGCVLIGSSFWHKGGTFRLSFRMCVNQICALTQRQKLDYLASGSYFLHSIISYSYRRSSPLPPPHNQKLKSRALNIETMFSFHFSFLCIFESSICFQFPIFYFPIFGNIHFPCVNHWFGNWNLIQHSKDEEL